LRKSSKHHQTGPDVESTRQKKKAGDLKTPGEETWRQKPKGMGIPGKRKLSRTTDAGEKLSMAYVSGGVKGQS